MRYNLLQRKTHDIFENLSFFVILRYWKVNSFFEVKVPNCDIKTHVAENAQNLKITLQNFA